MKLRRIISAAIVATMAMALPAAGAAAADVVVGSPLSGTFVPAGAAATSGTVANLTLADGSAHATSPVSGEIVRWRLLAAEGGPFALRVLRPIGGPAYTAVGSSSPVTVAGTGLESFSASIPIKAGDTIGLDIPKGAHGGLATPATSAIADWGPPIAEGATMPYGESASGIELGLNAEVQPQPTVSLINPGSGTLSGGTTVTIAGSDFVGVSSVSFGSTSANFSVASEGQITAVAPPGVPGATAVTVTTNAGTSAVGSTDQFTYTACAVPKLKKLKLKAAKKKLLAAGCKVGKVTRKKGVSAKKGKIVKQGAKPGKQLAPGSKVGVTLG